MKVLGWCRHFFFLVRKAKKVLQKDQQVLIDQREGNLQVYKSILVFLAKFATLDLDNQQDELDSHIIFSLRATEILSESFSEMVTKIWEVFTLFSYILNWIFFFFTNFYRKHLRNHPQHILLYFFYSFYIHPWLDFDSYVWYQFGKSTLIFSNQYLTFSSPKRRLLDLISLKGNTKFFHEFSSLLGRVSNIFN